MTSELGWWSRADAGNRWVCVGCFQQQAARRRRTTCRFMWACVWAWLSSSSSSSLSSSFYGARMPSSRESSIWTPMAKVGNSFRHPSLLPSRLLSCFSSSVILLFFSFSVLRLLMLLSSLFYLFPLVAGALDLLLPHNTCILHQPCTGSRNSLTCILMWDVLVHYHQTSCFMC